MEYKNKSQLQLMRLKLTLLFLLFFVLPNRLFAQEVLEEPKNNKGSKKMNELKNHENATKDKISDILLGRKADSLMFTTEEEKNIDRALNSYNSNELYSIDDHQGISENDAMAESERVKLEEEERNKNAKSYVYLASLLYLKPNEWIVWINDKKITSRDNNEENEFFIKFIEKGQAKIVWKIGLTKWRIISQAKAEDSAPETNENNKVEVSFDLMPNQTFILTTNEIVEGRP